MTGQHFIYGDYSLEQEKEAAYRRLLIREYFALNGPPDAPQMPIDGYQRDRAKHMNGLLGFVTANSFGRSKVKTTLERIHFRRLCFRHVVGTRQQRRGLFFGLFSH